MMPPRAYIFIGLNVVRILSIIGLILVFSSSILVMVEDIKAVNSFMSAAKDSNSTVTDDMVDCDYIEGSTVPNQPAGVFWAVLNRLLIIFEVVILFLSEIGWPYKFFDRFFPVLGTDFGLGPVGLFQACIGAAVLSHHVDDFALVSAFFLFSISCLNMLLGLIFREKAKGKRSITTWKEEKKQGLLPYVQEKVGENAGPLKPMFTGQKYNFFGPLKPNGTGNSQSPEEIDEKALLKSWSGESKSFFTRGHGWGNQGEKFAASQNLLLTRPIEALPPYGGGGPRVTWRVNGVTTRGNASSSSQEPPKNESRRNSTDSDSHSESSHSSSRSGSGKKVFKSSPTAL